MPELIYESHPDWGVTMFLSEKDMLETIKDLKKDKAFRGISIGDCEIYTLFETITSDEAKYFVNDRIYGRLEYLFERG